VDLYLFAESFPDGKMSGVCGIFIHRFEQKSRRPTAAELENAFGNIKALYICPDCRKLFRLPPPRGKKIKSLEGIFVAACCCWVCSWFGFLAAWPRLF